VPPTDTDGQPRRVRGYFTADIRAAVQRASSEEIGSPAADETDEP
jgi:hypothetical protein